MNRTYEWKAEVLSDPADADPDIVDCHFSDDLESLMAYKADDVRFCLVLWNLDTNGAYIEDHAYVMDGEIQPSDWHNLKVPVRYHNEVKRAFA